MVTIIIIGAVLIALIVGYTLHRQRKLQQQYQDEPIERVTKFDLEVDIKGGQAVGGYERRKSRVWVLMWAAIAAVIVVCAAICGIMKWNAGAEQRQMAKAEKQRQAELQTVAQQSGEEDDVALFSEAAVRKRFINSQRKELDELQAKLDKLEVEKQRLQNEWQNDLKKLSAPLKSARDSVYYRSLADLEEEQTEINSDMAKVQNKTIEMWQGDVGTEIFLGLFFLGVGVFAVSIWFGRILYWSGAAVLSVCWIILANLVGVDCVVLLLIVMLCVVGLGYMELISMWNY